MNPHRTHCHSFGSSRKQPRDDWEIGRAILEVLESFLIVPTFCGFGITMPLISTAAIVDPLKMTRQYWKSQGRAAWDATRL